MRLGLPKVFARKLPLLVALLSMGFPIAAIAQTPSSPPAPRPTAAPEQAAPGSAPPRGQIIIQSHGEPPPGSGELAPPPLSSPEPQEPVVGPNARADLTDADRSSLLITAYDLDVRLAPVRAAVEVRARLTVQNAGSAALKQLALQISSTLHWDSASLVRGAERTRLPLAQHRLETDADHTGAETEAILPLPAALQPGTSVALDLFYSGTVPASAVRLERMGASAAQGRATDWDVISPAWTGLRGFGNVLWYPVASPQLFFAEGNTLFEAIGHTRLREEKATVHLRLAVEYRGDAPVAAYFCGRRQPLKAVADDPDLPVGAGAGVATAEFAAEPLGFRTPSLFLLQQPETFLSAESTPGAAVTAYSSSASTAADSGGRSGSAPGKAGGTPNSAGRGTDAAAAGPFLALASSDKGADQGLEAAADRAVPVLREWLGPRPLSALTTVDHAGQPFQDGPFLVAPVAVLETSPETAALVQSLTHAWVQSGQPWMDDGLAQFFALMYTERESGREAAIAGLTELMRPVSLVEPNPDSGSEAAPGQPLITAWDDLYYRRKAAAVWWMLRGIVGDGNLHAALSAWRVQPASQAPAAAQAVAFQHLLERLSGQKLDWFFEDWVLRDRGLPDLTITDVVVAQEPPGTGHTAGWLVAVTVRNEGGAVADVPLIIHSGGRDTGRRMRIPGQSTVTERVLVETPPTSVLVNDGSTPEVRTSTHARDIVLQTR